MLRIYGVPISVHTRKVIVAAIAKGLPYELITVVPVIAASVPANWRALSPTGLIPVMSDGDVTLADSTAICMYLDKLHPAPPLYSADARELAQALWFEQYAGGTLFRHVVHPLFQEVFVQPNVNHVPADPAKIDAVLSGVLPQAFGYLESVAGPGFLAGPRWSIGDIAVVSNLVTLQYVGFELDARRYPKLAALFERVIMEPPMRSAIQAEQSSVQAMGLKSDGVRGALG